DAYAAQAAHQLGEAVALLRGYLVVLEQRGERDPDLEDALRGLGAGTARAQRFVDDLLDLAASRPAAPASARVALARPRDRARARLARELADAAARIHAQPLPVVLADRELVARLLVHLLRVALSAGARTIALEGEVDDALAVVRVSDDGTPA